jgi:hypothetical protein
MIVSLVLVPINVYMGCGCVVRRLLSDGSGFETWFGNVQRLLTCQH